MIELRIEKDTVSVTFVFCEFVARDKASGWQFLASGGKSASRVSNHPALNDVNHDGQRALLLRLQHQLSNSFCSLITAQDEPLGRNNDLMDTRRKGLR
jgi:hypothetical protein